MGDRIVELLKQGKLYREISEELGCSKGTIAYHARLAGLSRQRGRIRSPQDPRKLQHYDWSAVQAFHDAGNGVRKTIRHFGMSACTWVKAKRRGAVVSRGHVNKPLPLESLLVADRKQTSRTHLKRKLPDAGLLENICNRCGLKDWMGSPISCQLHHKNGKPKDNRLENLEMLCPNCHSQTDSFAGRNAGPK